MSKINIITYPDVLHNNALNILLIYPEKNILDHLQSKFLKDYDNDVNLYMFDRLVHDTDEINWVLTASKSADYTIIDTDNTIEFFRPLLSFIIAKQNSYWFSKSDESIYKHLSSNHVYDLSFLPKDDWQQHITVL